MIFNSLGSSYSWRFAWRFAFSFGSSSQQLRTFLSEHYGGRVWLYYRGRAALCEAIRLSGAGAVATNSFGCQAVEQAILAAEARPIFLDIERELFHFNLEQLKQAHKQNPDLGAVIVQNLFGLAVPIKPIAAYCRRHRIVLIEDLAPCPGNRYPDGSPFGSHGQLVILSFGCDKQIDVVNGGALVVRDQRLVAGVQAPTAIVGHRHKRRVVRLYPLSVVLLRSAYGLHPHVGRLLQRLLRLLKCMQAAHDDLMLSQSRLPSWRQRLILEQFNELEADTERRRQLIEAYNECITDRFAAAGSPALLRYPLLMSSPEVKRLFLAQLKSVGVWLPDHWYDAPVYPPRRRSESVYPDGGCPVMEGIAPRIVNLPLHRQMDTKLARVIGQTADLYLRISFRTDYTPRNWQRAGQGFKAANSNLLTSWEEGEAYAATGHKIWRLGVYQNGRPAALATAILIQARRGRFLKVPGGPLFKLPDRRLAQIVLAYLKDLARQQGCACVRIQPYFEDNPDSRRLMRELELRPSPASLNAEHTLKIDLKQPTEQMLASRTYKNTRSLINRARRLGLEAVEDNSGQSLADFLELLKLTQQNQGFVANSQDFIKAQFKAYAAAGKAHLHRVSEGGELLAAAIIFDHGGEAAYFYAASSKRGRQMAATYLLQWRAIVEAKERGLETYNLWGISPPGGKTQHRFGSLTRFKRNFSSNHCAYLPSHDAVVSWRRYLPLCLWETCEAKRRRL